MNHLRCPICESNSIAICLSNQAPKPSFTPIKEESSSGKEKEACIIARKVGLVNLQPDFPCVCQNCAYEAKVKDFS